MTSVLKNMYIDKIDGIVKNTPIPIIAQLK